MPAKARLLMADGTRLEGFAAGASSVASGELCFNTAMTGYQETYTDPSYYGQILVSTHVHIGNYGIWEGESESDRIQIKALICRSLSQHFSRSGARALSSWFEAQGVPILFGVDTRYLVKKLRQGGVMNAVLSTQEEVSWEALQNILDSTPGMEGLELSSHVSVKSPKDFPVKDFQFRVALLDLGFKMNIVRCLQERGCWVRVFPMDSKANQILDWQPDGILISNGPGDPATLQDQVEIIKELIQSRLPIFGICLGHQLLAQAWGLRTFKMHHGHRGINHPILNLKTGRGEITSQNHGFAVEIPDGDTKAMEVTHRHLNDNTIAGIRLKDFPAFSVQYHPEASAGPHDSRYLFDQFTALMA
ncbi:MAG: glutamine-hydrolyzing carbamoyl-phosphate synthase small subunit, partial [Flavobacteriales bacterium]|nr:glutamine-hydrolyzing carbamoyl-phosphate synthase small subunit [Flavobacteriales bacterium]